MRPDYYTARDLVQHVDALAALFPRIADDRAEAWRKLRRLEKRAQAWALRGCNGPEWAEGESERREASILDALDRLTGWRAAGVPVFLNGDPRGYGLKVRGGYAVPEGLQRDGVGYGIIAPEFG